AGRQSLGFAVDCSIFDDLSSTGPITLATQLVYERNPVHNLRWKVDAYRAQHVQHAPANHHRQVRLYAGQKDTREELVSLHEQAKALALLLLEWNSEFGAPATYPPSGTAPHTC